MGAESSWPLQGAIHALLAGDATLAALAPGGVHDNVPDGTVFPFVRFGPATVRDWSGKTFAGTTHALTLEVWSRARGRREAKLIAARLHELLHGASPSVAGHVLVDLRFEGMDAGVERDGLTSRAAVRFQAITQVVE